MDTVKVYNAKDEMEANMLMAVLTSAGIDCYSAEYGAGEWLKITSGFSVYGRDIYVEKKNEALAKSIIHDTLKSNNTDNSKVPVHHEEAMKIPWYKNRVILVRILLGFFVGSVALIYLLQLFCS